MATIWTDGCLACGYGCDNPAHLNFVVLVAKEPFGIGGEGGQFRPGTTGAALEFRRRDAHDSWTDPADDTEPPSARSCP